MTKKIANLAQLKNLELGDLVWVWHPETSKYHQVKLIGRAREYWEGKIKTWQIMIKWTQENYKEHAWYNPYNNRLEFFGT